MKRKVKRFLSVILCAAILLTVAPMSAFAADTGDETPYVEINISGKDEIKRGESTEIYIDYSLGGHEDAQIVWTVTEYCEYEYVTDYETGFKVSAKATAISVGECWVHVDIVDKNGSVLANDSVMIKVLDSRPLGTRIKEFFYLTIQEFAMLGYILTAAARGAVELIYQRIFK